MARLTGMELGHDGLTYVENCLRGCQGLSERALDLPLRKGKVIALLPEGTPMERARHLETGGLGIGTEDRRWFTRHLLYLRQKHPESAILIQDTASLAGDMCIIESEVRKFFRNSHVYYFLNSGDFSEEEIGDILYLSSGFKTFGFFVRCRIDGEAVLNREIDDATFSHLSQCIEEVFVSAYDRESFVIWGPSL